MMLVLPKADKHDVESISKRLFDKVNETTIDGLPENKTIMFSIGVMRLGPTSPTTLSEITSRADAILYDAKQESRNRLKFDSEK